MSENIVKYTIELEILIIKNSVNDSDLKALTKGCKYWYLLNQFFTLKSFKREVYNNET